MAYEIDLSTKNAAKLRGALDAYVAAARRIGGRSTKGRSPVTPGNKQQTQAIRAWARAQGLDVNDRGRVPGEIRAAYEAARK